MTDYALVILAFLTKNQGVFLQSQEIANSINLSKPTTSKLLKKLAKHRFIASSRGVNGGYKLIVSPEQITLADVIQKLEGPVAVVECTKGAEHCEIAETCSIKDPLTKVNNALIATLTDIKLTDLYNNIQGIA